MNLLLKIYNSFLYWVIKAARVSLDDRFKKFCIKEFKKFIKNNPDIKFLVYDYYGQLYCVVFPREKYVNSERLDYYGNVYIDWEDNFTDKLHQNGFCDRNVGFLTEDDSTFHKDGIRWKMEIIGKKKKKNNKK